MRGEVEQWLGPWVTLFTWSLKAHKVNSISIWKRQFVKWRCGQVWEPKWLCSFHTSGICLLNKASISCLPPPGSRTHTQPHSPFLPCKPIVAWGDGWAACVRGLGNWFVLQSSPALQIVTYMLFTLAWNSYFPLLPWCLAIFLTKQHKNSEKWKHILEEKWTFWVLESLGNWKEKYRS